MSLSRRELLQTVAAVPLVSATFPAFGDEPALAKVLVWDEQQPAQKQAYPDVLGNAVAGWLKSRPGIEVRSVRLDDHDQGLADADLAWANVLVWWGHVRQTEITPETAQKKIIALILAGRLSLIALHSAHWSTPFIEAMNERTRQDAHRRYPSPMQGSRVKFEFVSPPGRFAPASDSLVTPAYYALSHSGA